MGKITVIATDSYTADGYLDISEGGESYSWGLTSSNITRANKLRVSSIYDFLSNTNTRKSVPVKTIRGARVVFDFRTIAELTHKRITKISQYYIYQRSKLHEMSIEGRYRTSWGSFGSPGLRWLNEAPTAGDWDRHLNDTTYGYTPAVNNAASIYPIGTPQIWEILCVKLCELAPQYNGLHYVGEVVAEFDSHTGEHPPYVEVEYEQIPAWADGLVPTGGHIRGDAANTFEWVFNFEAVEDDDAMIPGGLAQQAAKVRWRPAGGFEYTEYRVGGQNTYTIPANTFTTSAIEWQVHVQSNDGVWAAEDTLTWVRVGVVAPRLVPVNLAPKGGLINGAQQQRFSWELPGVNEAEQSRYEAQYTTDNGVTWRPLSAEATTRRFFYVAAGTFQTGTIRWRVRCFNSAGGAGPWSEPATVLVQTAVQAPVITSATNKPRPQVAWTSTGQRAWQLQADGLYDSGLVYGEAKAWRIPVYLPPGPVRLRLRIADVFGFLSGWAVRDVVIANKAGPAIQLRSRGVANGARLEWETTGSYVRYLLYRDNQPVGQATGKSYTDWRAVGKHRYYVRGVTAEDYYTDSPPLVEITRVADAVLADVATLDGTREPGWIPLRYREGGYPTHSTTRERLVQFLHFAGRALPVAEVSEYIDGVHELGFTVGSLREALPFDALLGRTVLYKDCLGNLVVGLLHKYTSSQLPGVQLGFTLTEVDYREGDLDG